MSLCCRITQLKLVAGSKGFPQKSFTSSFLGTYYHDRGKGESKELSWQHGRPLPQAKQNEFPCSQVTAIHSPGLCLITPAQAKVAANSVSLQHRLVSCWQLL